MDITFKIFLALHIISGSIGLLTGCMNIIRKKGDKIHVIVGKWFIYSMLAAGISSLILSVLNPNYFLFIVGVFTLYMIITVNRYISFNLLKQNKVLQVIDWIITLSMLLAGVLFIGFGILNLIKSNLFGIVLITFGFTGLLFVRQDFNNYRGKSETKNYWLIAHLQRMIGGFIAALTAFLVVNAKYFPEQIPGVLYWLLPTIILTPLIIFWSRKFEKKKT